MRSEERSGIVFLVLLFLWGTLVTEPFRYFVTIINDWLFGLVSKTGLSEGSRIGTIIVAVVLTLISVGLLKLSSTSASNYFAPIFSSFTLTVFLVRSMLAKDISVKLAVILIVAVVVILITMFLKIERIWIWLSDLFIFSFPVFLLNAWVFTPIASISEKLSKIMFVSYKSNVNYAINFDGLLSLPAIVWGIFFDILMLLPVIYFVVGRRKG